MFKYFCFISLLSYGIHSSARNVKLIEVNRYSAVGNKIDKKESGTVNFKTHIGVSVFKSFIDFEPRTHVGFRVFPDNIVNFGHIECHGVVSIFIPQINQDSVSGVWCFQQDKKTLKHSWACECEPTSLSGSESVGILRYLTSIKQPSLKVIRVIEGGVARLKFTAAIITDKCLKVDGREEYLMVFSDNASLLETRFYELDTNRLLYLDRDSKFRYDYSRISYERRSGYSYHDYWSKDVLEKLI